MGHDFIILATTEFWEHYGYLGLFAGSFLSALFIPLGADLLYVSMLAMGFNPWLCLFVATTGGWIGGLVIYGVGYAGNATRIRKLFHIKEEQLLKQKNRKIRGPDGTPGLDSRYRRYFECSTRLL